MKKLNLNININSLDEFYRECDNIEGGNPAEINNIENVPEYSEKQKKQYNDAIKAYEHIGNGVSWSQFEWKTYDTQMTVTFEDSVKVESISKGMNVING